MRRYLIHIFCLLSFISCKKDNQSNNPNNTGVYVNLYIYENTPEFSPLIAVGGWIYKSGGEKGLIIYRKTMSDFVALERKCPYDGHLNTHSYVIVQADQITAKDTVCGSKFYITDGSVINGPASIPLRQYQTSYDGNAVHIFN